jgi:hypothetical protein
MKRLILLFLLLFLVSCSVEEETPKAKSELESGTYVLFVLNVHDWVFPEKSAEVVERTIEIHEKYKVPVEIYITDPVFQYYVESKPELVEKLKSSEYVTVSYHLRPPMPAYDDRFDNIGLMNMDEEEMYDTLLEYEEHKLDLETGLVLDEPGGYQFMKDIIGYAPITVGSGDIKKVLDQIYFEKGAKMAAVNEKESKLGDVRNSLYVRPQQVEIKLYEENNPYMRGSVTPESIVQKALNDYTGNAEQVFMNIKMHENNYYTEGTSWSPTYFAGSGFENPLEAPYDISVSAEQTKLRSEEYTDSMWELYEATVWYIANNPEEYQVVGPNDVLEMISGV